MSSSSDKHNSELRSTTLENKSPNAITVDGVVVYNDDTVVIQNGSEIIPGADRDGFLSYAFNIVSSPGTCQGQLKITIDVGHAKCSICINVWHDVVTAAPCLHIFGNGCFSEWLRTSQEKHSSVLCPQCRGVVQFVGKNYFLQNIAEIQNKEQRMMLGLAFLIHEIKSKPCSYCSRFGMIYASCYHAGFISQLEDIYN